jgi:CRP-like cAMP-binding protein
LLKLGAHAEQGIVPLAETALAHGLSAAQSQVLESYLYQHQYDSAGLLFAKGDPGSSVLLATGSVVDILIPLGNGRKKRVASFAPGVTFGEMALLEDMPRSADAFVQGPTLIWELSRERLTAIEQDHPDIARQVMLNISRILAQRLRVTTSELRLAIEG